MDKTEKGKLAILLAVQHKPDGTIICLCDETYWQTKHENNFPKDKIIPKGYCKKL